MPTHTNQYNDSSVSYEKLKEISNVLKKGRTSQSKIMDFILTILGCIVLKMDHRSRLQEFKDIFSSRSLDIIKNDLENLLYFNTKYFDSLVLEFLLEAFRKENNYHLRCIDLGLDERTHRTWNKVIFKKRVRAIVKFLIFRKTKTFLCFCDESSLSDWSACKQKIGIILNNEIDPKSTYTIYKIMCDKNNCDANITNYVYHDARNALINHVGEPKSDLQIKSKFFDKCTRVDHFCKLHCYRWLWICLSYCWTFFYLVVSYVTQKLSSEKLM